MTETDIEALASMFIRDTFYAGQEINSIDDVNKALERLTEITKGYVEGILHEGSVAAVITEQAAQADIKVSIDIADWPEEDEPL